MERNYAYPFKMGEKQKEVVLFMCEHDGRICEYRNHTNGRIGYELTDDEGNIEMDLTAEFVMRTLARNLFTQSTLDKSLDITVTEWKMKKELIEETILILK